MSRKPAANVIAARKRATIIAALEHWKRAIGTSHCEQIPVLDYQTATAGETLPPLRLHEIEELIAELKDIKPLVIDLEGGLIEGVSGFLLGQRVLTRDYDVECADEENLMVDEQGRQFFPGEVGEM